MASLPTVGGDSGTWGTKLNQFLLVGHNSDGSNIVDASNVTFTPSDNSKWNSSSDPGNTNDGLDQLASRVKTLEASTGSPQHAYFSNLCSLLEPDCLETFLSSTFSKIISSSETKYLIASFATRLGSSGRLEVRNPHKPMALRNVTLNGISAGSPAAQSSAILLNPALATYTNPFTKYYDRLKTIDESSVKVLYPDTNFMPFLCGAYGAIVVRANVFDGMWIVGRYMGGVGFNLQNEINDTSNVRFDNDLLMPLSKKVVCGLQTGSGSGSLAYILLPSTWSAITDSNTYAFRDDFMGTALDTSTVWTRTQSTTGNIEIDTDQGWCKINGSSVWGQNGLHTQSYSLARSSGKKLVADVFLNNGGLMIGLNNGSGQSYTNFSHAVNFNGTSLEVYENGTNRGAYGIGATNQAVYRIRITPTVGTHSATYEIQGGPYAPFGESAWTDITPGTSSSPDDTFYPGATTFAGQNCYIGDVRVY